MDCILSIVRFTVYWSVCVSWNRDVSVECWMMSAKVMCSLLTVYEWLRAHAFCKAQRLQLILDKLATNWTFKHQQAEWERQTRTGRNQSSVHDVCRTTLACSTLGSTAAMLTMVKSVKTLTKSVAVPLLDNRTEHKLGKVHGNAVC